MSCRGENLWIRVIRAYGMASGSLPAHSRSTCRPGPMRIAIRVRREITASSSARLALTASCRRMPACAGMTEATIVRTVRRFGHPASSPKIPRDQLARPGGEAGLKLEQLAPLHLLGEPAGSKQAGRAAADSAKIAAYPADGEHPFAKPRLHEQAPDERAHPPAGIPFARGNPYL